MCLGNSEWLRSGYLGVSFETPKNPMEMMGILLESLFRCLLTWADGVCVCWLYVGRTGWSGGDWGGCVDPGGLWEGLVGDSEPWFQGRDARHLRGMPTTAHCLHASRSEHHQEVRTAQQRLTSLWSTSTIEQYDFWKCSHYRIFPVSTIIFLLLLQTYYE